MRGLVVKIVKDIKDMKLFAVRRVSRNLQASAEMFSER